MTVAEKLDEKLHAKLSHLPTKDEFFGKMDEVMRELKTIREEVAVLGHQVSNHSDRINRIESRLAMPSD